MSPLSFHAAISPARHLQQTETEETDVPDSEGDLMPNRLRADKVAVHELVNAMMCIGPSLHRARDLQYATDLIPDLDLDLALRHDEEVLVQRVLDSVDGGVQAIVAMMIVAAAGGHRRRTEPAVAIVIRGLG